MTIKQLGGVFGRNPTFNDVTIEGTLTFDGALDINSDINLPDNKKITFGDGDDLQIYHDASNSYIDDVGTGNLFVRADSLQLRRADGSQIYLAANTGAEVALYYSGNAKLATTSTGIDVTGTVTTNNIYVGAGSATSPSVQMNDTNSGLFAPAGNTIAFSTAGGERVRIDSSGNLLVGTTATPNTLLGASATQGLAFNGSSGYLVAAASGQATAYFNRQTSDGTIADFRKDGASVGNIGVTDGDLNIYSSAASHGGLRFGNGWVAPTDNAGTLSDGAIDLGLSSGRFQDIWATNGTIQTSDRNEKQDIESLSEAEQRVAVAVKGLLRKFRWKSAVEEKGENARIHFGIIAQDLQAAFEAEGLDAGRYGMFINSTWTDEETGEERSRMGVRYSELLAFIIAAI